MALAASAAAAGTALLGLADVAATGARRYWLGGWPPPFGIELVLDPLSAFAGTVIAGVGALALMAAGAETAGRVTGPVFHALALLTLTGLLGIVASGDLFNVFVFLEVAAISSYALVASGGGPALAAAFRYVVLGTVGASFYLIGVGLFYAATGTLNMADLATRLPALAHSPLVGGGVAFVAVGLAIKMGLFPLHGWLPDTYTYAPPAVATLLAPLATKAAAYVLARILLHVVQAVDLAVMPALVWVGAIAIVAGGLVASRQQDARRLLAYSSVSHMGYIALGVGLASPIALMGAYLHILNHAVAKAALFMGLADARQGGRGPAVGTLGLRQGTPITATALIVASLSMVGVPPVAGFFSKWYLLQGALAAGQGGAVGAILVGSLLAAVYTYRLTESVWIAPHGPRATGREASIPLLCALVLLTIATVAIGLGNALLAALVLAPAAQAR